jgi:hypothetical protein
MNTDRANGLLRLVIDEGDGSWLDAVEEIRQTEAFREMSPPGRPNGFGSWDDFVDFLVDRAASPEVVAWVQGKRGHVGE